MQVKDILYSIDQGTQNLGSFIYSDFLPKEVLLQFNTVAKYFVRLHFETILPAEYKPLFEGIQLNLDDLKNLKIDNEELTKISYSTTIIGNQIESVYELPKDYEHKINLFSTGTFCKAQYNSNVNLYSSENFYTNVLNNPLKKPRPGNLAGYMYANFIKVCTFSGYVLDKIYLSYIRKVKEAKENEEYNEFSDEVITLLIDLTVRRLLEMSQSRRIQTKTIGI